MKIYLASGNLNKKREFSEILKGHEIVTPKDEGIEFDPEETGSDFYENSLIKAKALYQIVKQPVIADDSGICVSALAGRPGIFSARYAGPSFPHGLKDGTKISQDEQNRFLIQELNDELRNHPEKEESYTKENGFFNGPRSAHYSCAMVLYAGNGRLYVVQETMEGSLIEDIKDARGNGGFGYDPIFFLPDIGKTAAELTSDEKNAISHRGKAMRALLKMTDGIIK